MSMQTSAPKQLSPTHATVSLFDDVEWRVISVNQKLTGAAGYGDAQDLPIDLKFTNNFLSFKGCTVTFDLHLTGTDLTGTGYTLCAPMMFNHLMFDTGDSTLNIKDPRYAYLINYMRLSDDFRTSNSISYHSNDIDAKSSTTTTAVISVVMPLNILAPFMDMDRYYHGKQSRLTLTTDKIVRCITHTSGAITDAVIKNFAFHYKKIELAPAARNQILAGMSVNPYPFMFDNFKVDTRAIDGESSYQITNDRTYTQNVGIVCYGATDDSGAIGFNYYAPSPITLAPEKVNLRIGGGLTNEICIADNLTHMAVVAEAMNIDDYMSGCNDQLIKGILRGDEYGGLYLWETGLEQHTGDTCATGMALPTRNNFIDVDLKVDTPAGGLTTAQVANVIYSEEKLVQNGSTSMFMK